MAIDLETIRQLCLEGESNHLDYKREQYLFANAQDDKKAELLKDIMAFANAFRTQTAYILIGIAQRQDGTGEIKGIDISDFIDDSKLQQFINGKTTRTIKFYSYSVAYTPNNIIQVIEIPVQHQRPFCLKRRFASISERDVPLRIGSSTCNATADQIYEMGSCDTQTATPTLEISLIIPENPPGILDISALELGFDSESLIDSHTANNFTTLTASWCHPVSLQQKATWLTNVFRTVRIDISLKNTSPIAAKQLYVETSISDCNNECVTEVDFFPIKPKESIYPNIPLSCRSIFDNLLRPGQCEQQYKSLYIKVNNSGNFTLNITVFGENFSPVEKSFYLNAEIQHCDIQKEKIDSLFKLIADEAGYLEFRRKIRGLINE